MTASSRPLSGPGARHAWVNPAGVFAVWRRELSSLLGNPIGYFYILVFVLATAVWLFWFRGEKFFARNISDLGMLVDIMPWFLAVLLPALAMGSWAREKEQGTEELLLTLPLSITDALAGKFLAVSTYFTIALACSLTNVCALLWLGNPDLGLVFANYVGWWLAGLGFAALSIFASVLVSVPAIAFVFGVALCVLCAGAATVGTWWGGANTTSWFDDFNRGVIPLFNVVEALCVIALGLGAATLVLASRRWRPGSDASVWSQVLTLIFALILGINVAHVAQRNGAYADMSVEHLSSLSPASLQLLSQVNRPVTITAFISQNLPPSLLLKAKEIEDKLSAVQRATGRVKVEIKHPADELDADGQMATREFNLKTRKVSNDDVAGREPEDVFLGAAISCAGQTQVIDYFDPGLSVEYEVMRAVRGVTQAKKHVLGIAQTDLEVSGGFDFQNGGMIPEWEIVKEWRKQYDVHQVNLDSDVASDVDVLVVPQPSSLTQTQIEHLHDYIWQGRPTLLLEDPVPVVPMKAELIPDHPKKSANPYGGDDQQNGPKKGDIKPLWRALGLDYNEEMVLTSDYNPSHLFRGQIPNTFIWCDRSKSSDETTSPAVEGIDSLLFLFAGELRQASDKYSGLSITPLVRATKGFPWSRTPTMQVVHTDYMGRMQPDPNSAPMQDIGALDDPPMIAAEISGRMQAAYPEPEPSVAAAKPTKGPAPLPERKVGVVSEKPVHVIVVADTDCFSELFFNIYRNANGQFSDDQMRELTDLKNVQFAGNIVDALFMEQLPEAEKASFKALLELRTRRPQRRPLTRLESMLAETQDRVQRETDRVVNVAENAINSLRAQNDAEIDKIKNDPTLDDSAKADAAGRATVRNERKLQLAIAKANLDRDQAIKQIKSDQRHAIALAHHKVEAVAVFTPALLLLLLAGGVYLNRLVAERAHIPASRRRAA